MTETLESVIEAIRRAFTGVERGTMSLHEAELHDGGPDDDQLARARCLDTESSWEQVPDTAIEECRCALSYLDPVSWRFYVPAYMSWSLRHLLTSDAIVKDYTIYTFLIFEGFKARAQERFRALD